MGQLFDRLKRRGVWRVAIAYLAAAWLIIQVLETVLPIFDLPETSIRWVVIALGIGLLPALALAWLFEWTPQGLKRESEVDHDSREMQSSARVFDRAVIVVLALAVSYFLLDKFLVRPAPGESVDQGARTIAVLPFVDMTAAQDQAWFADGIAEEILNLLVRVSSLRVASRTSSFTFRDSALAIEEIARQLHVSHVIEGSVRRAGGRVRVTAQLISADSGFHVWSATYDRRIDDVFAIQDDIAAQIVAALQVETAGELPVATVADASAYALFLQARYQAERGSQRALVQATELYRQSLAIDPDYAPAWSELAAAYINQASSGFLDYHQGYEQAQAAALKSIETDPRHAQGYDQLAWIAFWYEASLPAALDYAHRAMAIDPASPKRFDALALLLTAVGRQGDAITLHEHIAARSPVDPLAIHNLALAYLYNDQLEDAARGFRKVVQLSPDYAGARYHLGETLLLMGRAEEAAQAWAAESDEAYRLKGEALAAFTLGDTARADAALASLTEEWGEQWPSEIAHVHAWRGELDQAFLWLEKEYRTYGAGGWGEWKLQRLYDNLRDDPRWQAFLRRVGVADEQLAALARELDTLWLTAEEYGSFGGREESPVTLP